jgi:apolipoprotein N-acyltransferase
MRNYAVDEGVKGIHSKTRFQTRQAILWNEGQICVTKTRQEKYKRKGRLFVDHHDVMCICVEVDQEESRRQGHQTNAVMIPSVRMRGRLNQRFN